MPKFGQNMTQIPRDLANDESKRCVVLFNLVPEIQLHSVDIAIHVHDGSGDRARNNRKEL